MENIIKSNIEEVKTTYGLNEKDLKIFATTLAKSFKEYPLFEYFSNYKYDVSKMTKFWEVSLNTMSEKTIFITDSVDVNSMAIFSPYEKKGVSVWKYIKSGGLKLIFKMGFKSVKKMMVFEDFALKIKNKYSNSNCWYLYAFVTIPELRGKGFGSKILKPMFKYLDENKQDCYLETLHPVNVEIYKKYGFELKEAVKVPNTDLTLYAMFRQAKDIQKNS